MKTILAAAVLLAAVTGAGAAEPPKKSVAGGGPNLSVLEAINVGQALRQLGDHPGADGKTIAVAFRFDGAVLFAMATDIAGADIVIRNYQQAYNALAAQAGVNIPLDKDAPADVVAARVKKKAAFDLEAEKMMNAPSGGLWVKIKRGDLCLDAKPVAPCTTTNAIPPGLLAAMIPILD